MDLKDILKAQKRLANVVHNIPLEKARWFSEMAGGNIYLKCEHRQKTGSFKVRGAYNKIAILNDEKKLTGVIAASAGNHAQGVAYAARQSGIKSIIVMPRSAPISKILATKAYGAEIVLYGDCYDDAYMRAKELEIEMGAEFIPAYNDYDVIAGQGTVGVEIINEFKNVDIVVIPAGGGGLLAGAAFAIKSLNPCVKVVGVQPQKADALVQSYDKKLLTPLAQISTIADGLAVKNPGDKAFEIIKDNVDEMVTVSDDEIASVIIDLMERTKQVVEPAGAASIAAVLGGKINVKGKNVVSILSGGNIDVGLISKIIEKGLIKRGRRLSISVLMQDSSSGLEKVSGIIARNNANIIDIRHDRLMSELQMKDVILYITCEVSGQEQSDCIIKELIENGFTVKKERQIR